MGQTQGGIRLSARLRAIVDCVARAHTAADIGCDHGYAARALAEEGRAERVIACDISAPSLEKTKRLIKARGLEGRVEARLGDGLEPLADGEADAVMVAGMGGLAIRDILRRGEKKAKAAKWLVFSPNRNEYELRKYLCENGFVIEREELAPDGGRFYQLLCARAGEARAEEDDFYYDVGRRLIEQRHPLLAAFLRKKIAEAGYILERAANGENTGEYAARVLERKRRMEGVLQCL